MNFIEEVIKRFQSEIDVDPKFLQSLLRESDWSFVIKAHAFFEAAFNHVLLEAIEKDELQDVIPWLELSGTKTGKLAFAKAMGILDEAERRFVRSFSELRNSLVHDIHNVNFNFEKYVNNLDPNQLKVFRKTYSYFYKTDILEHEGKTYKIEEFVTSHPKTAVWFCVIIFATTMYLKKRIRLLDKESSENDRQIEILNRGEINPQEQSGK